MINLPDKMTSDDIAKLIGKTRQTVNRWIKKYKWQTEKQPGVKGGRARNVLMTQDVVSHLMKTSALQALVLSNSLAEPAMAYGSGQGRLHFIIKILQKMTADEAQQFEEVLGREGLRWCLSRLGINQTINK